MSKGSQTTPKPPAARATGPVKLGPMSVRAIELSRRADALAGDVRKLAQDVRARKLIGVDLGETSDAANDIEEAAATLWRSVSSYVRWEPPADQPS